MLGIGDLIQELTLLTVLDIRDRLLCSSCQYNLPGKDLTDYRELPVQKMECPYGRGLEVGLTPYVKGEETIIICSAAANEA